MRYYILNTNKRNVPDCEDDMLRLGKCSAYNDKKHKIEKILKGDIIFLYSSGRGIIPFGIATGDIEKSDFKGGEEYSQKLIQFKKLNEPISYGAVNKIIFKGKEKLAVNGTLVNNSGWKGEKIFEYLTKSPSIKFTK
ncbi:hypothetical protein G8C92_06535 [Paenibacillus donghaensis]|uniref:hypothetical protein n=1 Tax=Paenibacillus donghaensis TaxID=414771 RepID=UPI00188319AC|nr:hypothetical protein [Paenibacillus donghaensis]MBE9913687.1 hypothetical protein [Paenibacillus donghaensis]